MATLGGRVHPAAIRRRPLGRMVLVSACVLVVGLAVAWLYYPMRAVMDVGGYCAEGGPYVIETHCPAGSTTFLMLGVPLWIAGVFIGLIAATISAPQPIFPAWALLFGALGWNFIDFAFNADPSGNILGSWLVCGIVFWVMALPAVVMFVGGRLMPRTIPDSTGSGWGWVAAYLAFLAAGWWLGSVTLHAWS